jgi:hypothetical protein
MEVLARNQNTIDLLLGVPVNVLHVTFPGDDEPDASGRLEDPERTRVTICERDVGLAKTVCGEKTDGAADEVVNMRGVELDELKRPPAGKLPPSVIMPISERTYA